MYGYLGLPPISLSGSMLLIYVIHINEGTWRDRGYLRVYVHPNISAVYSQSTRAVTQLKYITISPCAVFNDI